MIEGDSNPTRSSISPDLAFHMLVDGLGKMHAASGLSLDEVARRVRTSRSSAERWIKGGKRNLSERDVEDLCEAYGNQRGDETTIKFVGLAQAAGKRTVRESRAWFDYYQFGLFLDLQRACSRISTYEQTTIPGLLQTKAFAEAVIRATAVEVDEDRIAEQVELRAERQQILYRENPVHLHALIDESALRRTTGSLSTMRDQMDHLLQVSELDNITIRIMPFAGGPAAAGPNGSFVVMEFEGVDGFDGMGPISYQETVLDADYGQTPEQAGKYAAAFARLSAVALSETESAMMITAARDSRHPQTQRSDPTKEVQDDVDLGHRPSPLAQGHAQ